MQELIKNFFDCNSYNPQTYCLGTTILIISNQEMDDSMKIVKSLEDLFLIGVTITTESGTREKRGQFFSMLLGK